MGRLPAAHPRAQRRPRASTSSAPGRHRQRSSRAGVPGGLQLHPDFSPDGRSLVPGRETTSPAPSTSGSWTDRRVDPESRRLQRPVRLGPGAGLVARRRADRLPAPHADGRRRDLHDRDPRRDQRAITTVFETDPTQGRLCAPVVTRRRVARVRAESDHAMPREFLGVSLEVLDIASAGRHAAADPGRDVGQQQRLEPRRASSRSRAGQGRRAGRPAERHLGRDPRRHRSAPGDGRRGQRHGGPAHLHRRRDADRVHADRSRPAASPMRWPRSRSTAPICAPWWATTGPTAATPACDP